MLDRANRPATSDGTPSGWIGSFTGADAFVASLAQFVQMVKRVELYGDREAALLYECVTRSPAGVIRTAEFFRLDEDGRIDAIRLVFDATELRKLMPPSAESRITHCPWRWPGTLPDALHTAVSRGPCAIRQRASGCRGARLRRALP